MISYTLLPLFLCVALWAHPASGAAQAPAFVFPPVDGWTLSPQPQVFAPDSLYEYIDGGADLYLKYEFQELQVAEYRNPKQASVSVEVYRHRDPVHAFGIYSQERLPGEDFLEIGAQGYYESTVLNFLKGSYYVKLSSESTGADDREILLAFARRISQELAGPSALPAILDAFPSDGKRRHSEKFVAKDFLGYAFLHSGFTADYELSGKKFQLFVIAGKSPDDARSMLQSYLGRIGNAGTAITEGPRQVRDPYHGEMALCWRGKSIWGTMSLDDPELRTRYLKQFEEMSAR